MPGAHTRLLRVIRPISDADLAPALAIAQEAVGPGWAEREDLLGDPARRRVVVAEDQGVLVGVATAGLRNAIELLHHRDPRVGRALAGAGIPGDSVLLLLDLAAVIPAARGRGHYRSLLDDRLAWGAREGAGHALTFGWTPPDGCHIAPAMERAGFTRHADLPGFFHRASIETGALCPACGNPCLCGAAVFTCPIGPRRFVQAEATGSSGTHRDVPGGAGKGATT